MDSQDLIVRLYQLIRDDHPDRPMERWHASAIAQCPRSIFYARSNIARTSPMTTGIEIRYQVGHEVEKFLRPYLEQMMPDLESNVRLSSDKLDLTGEYDNFDPKTNTLWEVKSVHPQAVRYRKVSEDSYNLRDDQAYLSHQWQNHAYVLLLAEQNITVKEIGYIYVSLSGLVVTYKYPVNQQILKDVTDRIERLNTYWSRQQLPPCFCADTEHQFYKSTMQYCDYKTATGCCEESLWQK